MKSRLYIQLCAVYYTLLAAGKSPINTVLNQKFKGQNLCISQHFQIVKVVPFMSFLFDLLVFYFVRWSPVLFSSILQMPPLFISFINLNLMGTHYFGQENQPFYLRQCRRSFSRETLGKCGSSFLLH